MSGAEVALPPKLVFCRPCWKTPTRPAPHSIVLVTSPYSMQITARHCTRSLQPSPFSHVPLHRSDNDYGDIYVHGTCTLKYQGLRATCSAGQRPTYYAQGSTVTWLR